MKIFTIMFFVMLTLLISKLTFAKTYYVGNYSGVTWGHETNAGSYKDKNWVFIPYKNTLDKKISLGKDYLNDYGYCFDFSSNTFFNTNLCDDITFVISSRIKKEPENTNRINKFIKLAASDFCEDAIIEAVGEIKKGTILISGKTAFKIKCPKVIAAKNELEDQKDLILANSNTFEYNCNGNWQGIDKKTNEITGTSVDPVTFKFNFEQQRYFSKFNETEFIDLVDDPSFVSFDGSKFIAKEIDIGDGMISTLTFDFENDELVVWPKDATGYLRISCSPNYELLKTINKITKKDDKKKELLLASVNEKRDLCFSMGFEENTEGLANCILQLMLHENKNPKTKEQTVVITTESNNNQQTNIMSEQTRIMQRQLELQELQNTQKMMKTFQYMMDFGKMPPLGYGY